jgi:proline iminopeptidase
MSTHTITQTPVTQTAPPTVFQRAWADLRIRAALVLAAAGLSGLAVAATMPRGPTTAAQTLAVMALGLIVGGLAGVALRSRWAALPAMVMHVAVLELTRWGVAGPTVDLPRLDNIYGILALVLGRGFHGVVGLMPMLVGAAYGTRLATRLSAGEARLPLTSGRISRSIGTAVLGLTTVALLALAVAIAWPASTPPILGADGKPVPGSITTLEPVRLGGHDQWISIRGVSTDKPVLLWLSGGPGQSDLAFTRVLSDLEQEFVVVNWDQRGQGKSYSALDPTDTWTLDQAVSDTLALSNYLRERFGETKIYLAGESWGTTLGVLAVQRQPELYYAWIASGQMVSQLETDRRIYRDLLAYAGRASDADLTAQLQANGEPPYASLYGNSVAMQYYPAIEPAYTQPAAYAQRGEAARVGPWGMFASEYNLVEKVNVLRGLMDMFSVMYPQLQSVDFRRDVPRLEVPVFLAQGVGELQARHDLALEWFELLEAPEKHLFTLEQAGHSTLFERSDVFYQIMTEMVPPATADGQ